MLRKWPSFFFLPPSRSGVGSSQLRHFINSCYLTSRIVVGLLRPPSHCNQQQCHQLLTTPRAEGLWPLGSTLQTEPREAEPCHSGVQPLFVIPGFSPPYTSPESGASRAGRGTGGWICYFLLGQNRGGGRGLIRGISMLIHNLFLTDHRAWERRMSRLKCVCRSNQANVCGGFCYVFVGKWFTRCFFCFIIVVLLGVTALSKKTKESLYMELLLC